MSSPGFSRRYSSSSPKYSIICSRPCMAVAWRSPRSSPPAPNATCASASDQSRKRQVSSSRAPISFAITVAGSG